MWPSQSKKLGVMIKQVTNTTLADKYFKRLFFKRKTETLNKNTKWEGRFLMAQRAARHCVSWGRNCHYDFKNPPRKDWVAASTEEGSYQSFTNNRRANPVRCPNLTRSQDRICYCPSAKKSKLQSEIKVKLTLNSY